MIIGIFGKPRSGKSTLIAKYVSEALTYQIIASKKRWYAPLSRCWYRRKAPSVIFSTEPMPGTVLIKSYDIGLFEPPDHSLFIIHEAGCDFNNRLINKIPQHCGDFFAQHGHYKANIIYDSQTVDVDKRLRVRTHQFYVVSKCPVFRHRSKVVKIKYWIGVNSDAKTLDECYTEPDGFFAYLIALLTRQIYKFNRRKYYRYFDSYSKRLKFKFRFQTDDDGDPAFDIWRAPPELQTKGMKLEYSPMKSMKWPVIKTLMRYDLCLIILILSLLAVVGFSLSLLL